MQWWDIYVQVPEPMEEVVSAYLQYLGSTGVVIYDRTNLSPAGMARLETDAHAAGWSVLYGALPADATLPVRVCALQQFLDASPASSPIPRWKLWCRPLQEVAYLTQWQRFFRPLNVAQRLMIRPPWDTTPVSPAMASLVLDPGLAFGTGLHPTTYQCLMLLAQCITPGRGGRLLDVGCGSGILSLAALKLGADTAVGVDIDAQAVDVARRNAMLNSLQEHVQFLEGTVDMATGQFTWIAANIYLSPLVAMMPAFAKCLAPQGSVILSGILEQQEAALQASLHAAGLEVQCRLAAEGWVALEGRRTSAVLESPAES
jgi:ribosomal protein L11 methyltransferase